MKKIFAKRALIIMSIIFAIGLIFVFSSVKAGENAGHKAMKNNGGSMDTNAYYRVIDTTTLNYQLIGGVLSLIGGCGVLISGYALYKEI
ncbi:hypothetical protein PBV87_18055 [Niameybacter massiliensis]|uniref:Uncharacterized protein n=1 Tax=Holtiella tumoricola TaxID=3018743 RepID=A0AA42J2H2_9FIRM|nr:hypothetical protein [Holtiella tumoricola]MDA3733385.1 hypothetical protein [Holtiella tumoricola]